MIFNTFLLNNYILLKALGAPVEGQFLFQTPASPYMEGIVDLHHYIMFFLVVISIFVFWLIIVIVFSFDAPDLLIRSEKLICSNLISFLTSFKNWSVYHSLKNYNFFDAFFKNFNFINSNGFLYAIIKRFFWFLNFESSLFNLFRYSTFSQTIRYKHGTIIEFVWTVFPCFILLLIAIPSYRLLFSAEDVVAMHHVIKVIGHQWYWTYEYTYVVDQMISNFKFDVASVLSWIVDKEKFLPVFNIDQYFLSDNSFLKKNYNFFDIALSKNNFMNFEFINDQSSFIVKSVFITSYMLAESDLPVGGLRLLEVDNVLRVPAYTHLHFLITSSDVIHSWAIPSLGIKVDAVPGRLNENVAYIARPGVFYGQCSEICGVNHAFMPICVVAYDH